MVNQSHLYDLFELELVLETYFWFGKKQKGSPLQIEKSE